MAFPLDLRFKVMALASRLTVTDAGGNLIYLVKHKAFKLKEAVTLFADEGQTRPLYTINVGRILDVSPRYRAADPGGAEVAVVQRLGMRSFWKAHYEVHQGSRTVFLICEENPWIKVLDGIVSAIPIVALFFRLHVSSRLRAVERRRGAAAPPRREAAGLFRRTV